MKSMFENQNQTEKMPATTPADTPKTAEKDAQKDDSKNTTYNQQQKNNFEKPVSSGAVPPASLAPTETGSSTSISPPRAWTFFWDYSLSQVYTTPEEFAEAAPEGAVFYVSPKLDFFWHPSNLCDSINWRGVAYDRLTPDSYALMRRRMENVKRAFKAGKLDKKTFDGLRQRFNALHAAAVRLFGEHELVAAIGRLDAQPKSK